MPRKITNSIESMVNTANERMPERKRVEREWFTCAMKDDSAELSIYDEIGFWGTSAKSFKETIDSIKDKKNITLSINSPGGDVFDGFAIYNMLMGLKGELTVRIDALAASIASVIAMAGDVIVMPKTSMLMIHNPWVFAAGESEDLRNMADLLDAMKDNAIAVYQTHTNKTKEELSKMMDVTTWMTAEQAIESGFDMILLGEEAKNIVNKTVVMPFVNLANIVTARMSAIKQETINLTNKGGTMPDSTNLTQEQLDAQKAAIENEATLKAQAQFKAVYNSLIGTAKALEYNDQDKLGEIVNKVIAGELTEAKAKDEIILAHQAKMKAVPSIGDINITADEHDKYRKAVKASFAMNAGLKVSEQEKADVIKNGFAGMTLQSLVREHLIQNKILNASRMSGSQMYDALMNPGIRMAYAAGTSDFANILADTANKALETGWMEAPTTYQMWVDSLSVNDFKTFSMMQLSPFADVERIYEGEAFRFAKMSDKKETVQVKTWGKAFSLTREAIVNDDLNAFVVIPRLMAESIRRKIDKSVYDSLVSNTFAGPTMTEDSYNLFDATNHGNYTSSAGAAPSVSEITKGQIALATRPLPSTGDKKTGTVYTESEARFIIVPTTLKVPTEQVILSGRDISKSNDITYNPYTGLQVVSSAYLNSKSTTRWYLAAQRGHYVVATLAGQSTPVARSKNSDVSEPLGVVYDIYFDFEVGVRDWRYIYQNKGAA